MIRLFTHPLIPRKLWLALLGFSLIIHLMMLVLPIYSLQVFDRVLGSGSLETLAALSVIVVIALIGQVILERLRAKLLVGWAAGLDEAYAAPLAARSLTKVPPKDIANNGRLTGLMAFTAGRGPASLLDAIWTPVYLLVLTLLHPWLGGLATVTVLVLITLAGLREKYLAAKSSSPAIDWFGGQKADIQALGFDHAAARWWSRETKPVRAHWEDSQSGHEAFGAMVRMIRGSLQIGIMALGAYLVVIGQATPGIMIAGSILGLRAVGPIEQAFGALKGLKLVLPSLDYLSKLDRPTEGTVDIAKASGDVKVQAVTVLPGQASAPLLNNIDIDISAGSLVRIIGASGTGKTTLAQVLSGAMSPNRGTVQLGGCRITDERAPTAALVRETFITPIGEVIDILKGYNDQSFQACMEAANMAGIHEDVIALPEGYNTRITDDGITISRSTAFRLALSQAILSEAKLIILDCPEAVMDRQGLGRLQTSLETIVDHGTTVVVLSRHDAAWGNFDQTYVLNSGRLTEVEARPRAVMAAE